MAEKAKDMRAIGSGSSRLAGNEAPLAEAQRATAARRAGPALPFNPFARQRANLRLSWACFSLLAFSGPFSSLGRVHRRFWVKSLIFLVGAVGLEPTTR